ncbi:DUF1295 domain-containing protein [Marinihelvus fidelis]|uniref:DUF1295 domain-containing protein n=1 Tax=Marinihelvus fidelis TaxID=2613842 RepID=A0A5N0TGA1_9GAMM|nr:DUF1295 domain-containing protein [Marinihelvus fidelis]KAA9134193.1 DUF1295 domain-containing protein [Marinihelvus fidelis]
MIDWTLYGVVLAALLAFAILAWLFSLVRNDVSIVDSLWSLMILGCAAGYAALAGDISGRGILLLVMAGAWAFRLSAYITWRNHGEGEDRRYRAMRERRGPSFRYSSLYIVFGLQAVLAWVIALPLVAGVASQAPLGWLDLAGVLTWAVGFAFEAIGDAQMARFQGDPANRGEVLDTGLWRYTRHPNYFGECVLWWGFFLLAAGGGAAWTVVSPVLMTLLLLKVSGVSLLEKDIGERRPAYARYVRQTNAFIPGPAHSEPAS